MVVHKCGYWISYWNLSVENRTVSGMILWLWVISGRRFILVIVITMSLKANVCHQNTRIITVIPKVLCFHSIEILWASTSESGLNTTFTAVLTHVILLQLI